jgi:hypothetical protein
LRYYARDLYAIQILVVFNAAACDNLPHFSALEKTIDYFWMSVKGQKLDGAEHAKELDLDTMPSHSHSVRVIYVAHTVTV